MVNGKYATPNLTYKIIRDVRLSPESLAAFKNKVRADGWFLLKTQREKF
jgi:hypothetical protein